MKIHEYQAKEIFRKGGLAVPHGEVAQTPDEAAAAAARLGGTVAVKAQVHVGGRGKAGGIKLAKSPDEARDVATKILGMQIKGSTVRKVLIERGSAIAKEAYLAVTIDRSAKGILFIASAAGGIDIEEVAAKTPEKILRVTTPRKVFPEADARKVAAQLFGDEKTAPAVLQVMKNL
ncbi:MAG TPA: ATP-grasp domain-containing protein, partial [Kiritimatiellia bacterium]